MLVQIATQGWGWVADPQTGRPRRDVTVQIRTLNGSAATTWNVPGGTSSTADLITNADGTLPGWIETGPYLVTIGTGATVRVEAVRGNIGDAENARSYGFLPENTAAANDTAIAAALAAVIPPTNPVTTTRVPTRGLYVPAGQYKVNNPPIPLTSVMGFKLFTDGPKATVFDVQQSMEAPIVINGGAHNTFQGFTVKTKDEGLDASVTVQKAVKLYWDSATAARSTTRNRFNAIDVANCRYVYGVQMGRDGDSNQCDTTQIDSMSVIGIAARGYGDVAAGSPTVPNVTSIGGTFTNGWEIYGYGIPPGTTILSGGGTGTLTLSANVAGGFTMTHTSLWACPAGLFQDAVKLGSGVQGNNYGHQVGYLQAGLSKRGVNFANAGGIIGTYDGLGNQTDFYVSNWTSMLEVQGGRSEHAQRMIDTPGSSGLSGPLKFSNLMWDALSLHGDRGWVQYSGGGSLALEGISVFDLNPTQPILPGLRITPNQVARQMTQVSLKGCVMQVPLSTLIDLIDPLRVNVNVEGYSEIAADLTPVKHTAFNVLAPEVVLTYGASIPIDHGASQFHRVVVNDAVAHTFAAPTNRRTEELTILVQNTTGGAIATSGWNAIFKLGSAWVSPAAGKVKIIKFHYFAGLDLYYEVARSVDL